MQHLKTYLLLRHQHVKLPKATPDEWRGGGVPFMFSRPFDFRTELLAKTLPEF
jgi:hypothetical protein